jgi:PAS domain S-box-containing protein
MGIKPKAAAKPNPKVKSKPVIKPKNNRHSQHKDLSNLSEDIISNVGVGIYIVQQGKFAYVSSLYKKLAGYSDTELINQNPLDYLHPDDREMTRKNAIKVLKRESSDPYEYRFIKKTGEAIWVLEMVTSITYKEKRAVLGSFMDITERKRMENSLRESEEKHRTILENIEDGYIELDLKGNFIFFNEALCKIQGYPKDELMKLNYRELMDEENAKKMFQQYNKVYTTGNSEKEIEYEIITKGGIRRHIESSITPIKNAGGRIIAFRGVVRDITERLRLEEALRRSEERYRTILEEMDNTYFELDLAGHFTFVNDSNCRLLGYSQEELLGTDAKYTVVEEDRKYTYNIYSNIFRTAAPAKGISYSYRVVCKDGTTAFAETTAFPLKNEKGEIIGFRGVGRDVTERKRMEGELREMSLRDQLTELYNRRGFITLAEQQIKATNRVKRQMMFSFIDVDGLKWINDTLGHEEGDNALIDTANIDAHVKSKKQYNALK